MAINKFKATSTEAMLYPAKITFPVTSGIFAFAVSKSFNPTCPNSAQNRVESVPSNLWKQRKTMSN